ncbi:MAG TPA: gamma-glutamyltransferase, partial [Nakamurella sp.]|nr:gamma-glutamyltransferase [Nakamurella sp.]
MTPLPASVAAGHPATATVGRDVLARGGSAADAVAAMILVGCVAETLFTGLGGGGFATVYHARTKSVHCLDFFVAVPGLDGTVPAAPRAIQVSFGDVEVPYSVGGPSVAVP